ncbi:Hint domain-containing protein [Acidisphaera sp. S103]|uniref:Hint domain-containing protein n=1 Tax=Acidisphaera sp. S103 TaxID=1747223 RepID=UPI00131DD1B7|nr:Hint domain-containing protein [Acidisphaera sp. S103]
MSGSTWTWIGGTINVDSPSDWELTAGPGNTTNIPESGDTAINTGTLVGSGLIAASLINSGTVEASNNSVPGSSTGGELEIQGSVSGNGSITIEPGATLAIDGTLGAGQTIVFSPGAPETLILGSPTATTTNAITGFADGDKIEIANGMVISSGPIFTNGQTLTINLQNAGGVNSSYAFTNISFAASTVAVFNWENDPATDDPAIFPTRDFSWIGTSGGNLATASNWIDETDGKDPALAPPVATDTDSFSNGIGGALIGTITAEMLFFNNAGTWSIGAGTEMFASQRLFVGGGTTGSLTIGAGGILISGGNIFVGNAPGGNGTLTVSSGGLLRQNGPANPDGYDMEIASNAASGTLAASVGLVTVTGAGSLIDMGANGIVIAEDGGNGALTVSQGGSVNATTYNSNLYNSIAIGRLGNGTLTVTDPGSRVSANGLVYVAHTETGTLTVENSATFLATPDATGVAGVIIGEGNDNGVGGTGIADVTTGGDLLSQGYVIVGLRGTAGQLTVNGGTVQVGTTLAVGTGGTITGTGGVIANDTTESGNGTLSIGTGGTVELTGTAQTSSYGVYIASSNNGTNPSESGVATVSGTGALLNANGNGIAVGQYGSGTLTVSQGGTVVSGTANSSILAALGIGRQGVGNVIVDSGTLLANGEAFLGRAGSGDLLVENNGSVHVGLDGTGSTTDGALQVGGAGYTAGTLLYVGGTGSMEVESGGIVSSQLNIDVGYDGSNGTLSINHGIVETSQLIHIGISTTAAVGDTIITAAGTTAVTAPTLEAGNGSVDIGPGGTLISTSAALSIAASGTSSIVIGGGVGVVAGVTVHGAGALLSAGNNRLGVGDDSEGSLLISQGGSAFAESAGVGSPAMYIGATDTGTISGTGAVTVTDLGSGLTALGQLNVGWSGIGSLLIQNQASAFTGGYVNDPAQGLDVGTDAGASGAATITGPASLLSNTGAFIVGDAGLGSLSIQSGGTVITSPGTVADLAGAVIAAQSSAAGSSVTVTGGGSGWRITGSLDVGMAGAGVLSITNDATVTAAALDAGVQTSGTTEGTGQISLSGAGSNLDISGGATIGDAGSANLSILDGATFAAGNLTIGSQGTGSGAVFLSDAGSALDIAGTLNVGTALGVGELTLGPNASVFASKIVLQGAVVNEGGLLDPTEIDITQGQSIVGFGTEGAIGAVIVNDGLIEAAAGTKPSQKVETVIGTIVGTFDGLSGSGELLINAGSTLELTGGPVDGSQSVVFGANSGALVVGDIGGFQAVITNFVAGDTIVVDTPTPATFTQNGSVVSVVQNGTTLGTLDFATPQMAQAAFVTADALVDNALCFLAGTLIDTPDGPVAVERLAAGDRVRMASGAVRPVMWVGHGRVLATRGRRSAATPVIVRKGALGPNVPSRGLRVTKGHALWFDGVLIPVEFLVNHRSILWDDRAQEVSVFHVELETHDVLVANGAAAESYRDDGNRWLFHNANSGWDQPAKTPCAPVLTGGPVVDAVWRRLLDACGPRPSVPLTEDPDLHLLVDGARVEASHRTGDTHVFAVDATASTVRLVSRAAVPQELGVARDPRCLGVTVRQVVVRQGTRFRVARGDDARLEAGWHPLEAGSGLRWTDGNAALPGALFADFSGPCELVVHIGGTTRYVDDGEVAAVA